MNEKIYVYENIEYIFLFSFSTLVDSQFAQKIIMDSSQIRSSHECSFETLIRTTKKGLITRCVQHGISIFFNMLLFFFSFFFLSVAVSKK